MWKWTTSPYPAREIMTSSNLLSPFCTLGLDCNIQDVPSSGKELEGAW